MASYPISLPLPEVSDYSIDTAIALSSIRFERGNTRQRRGSRRERQVFTLSFLFSAAELWTWQSWVNENGYDWHTMELESSYSGLSVEGLTLIPHVVRYITDISVQLASPGLFRVAVQAEMDVSTTPTGLLVPSGNWYVGGAPATPATDTITAGSPSSLAANTIIAGSPALPAA